MEWLTTLIAAFIGVFLSLVLTWWFEQDRGKIARWITHIVLVLLTVGLFVAIAVRFEGRARLAMLVFVASMIMLPIGRLVRDQWRKYAARTKASP